MVDRVYPIKRERVSSGGSQNNKRETKLNAKEDTIPMYKEVLIVDDETDLTGTINQGIRVDSDHDLNLFDRNSGTRKVSEILGSVSQNTAYSENTGDSYSTRDNITFANQKAGDYLIEYTFHYGLSSSDLNFIYDLLINDSSKHENVLVLPDSEALYIPITSFYKYTLASDGNIVVKLNYKTNKTWGVAKINFSAYNLKRI